MASDWEGEYLKPGTLIDDKYEVCRVLGTGAMGAVIEATHVLRRATVALKFMSPRMIDLPGVVERFLNEGVAASRINNEHVVKVLDVSKLPNGQPYLVMEYLDGEDLSSLLEREGRHGLEDIARAVHFVLQVLRGLQVAHRAGIIHRDLKPANCFVVAKDGEPDFIKIVDFGISKVQEAEGELNLTQEGSTLGTPLYVSLEQARDAARVDARSDLYSVACMLYELLCGHTPFIPKSLPDLFVQLATVIPRSLDEMRDLPKGLAAVVQRGLEKDPADRYQSAAEMAAALSPYADERSELVIRQLLQRPSAGTGRPSSGVPPRSSLKPASEAVPADGRLAQGGGVEGLLPSPSAGSDVPGTLLAVSKSDAVAAKSALNGPAKPKRLQKTLVPVLLIGVAALAAAALATRSRSTSSASRDTRADAPEVSVPAAASEPQVIASVRKEPAPVVVPSPSIAIPVPSAMHSGMRAQAEAHPRPSASASKPSNVPSLKKIGIQD